MAMTRARFDKLAGALPAATLGEQWEASCAKVGGKVFALFGLSEKSVVFKVGETSFEMLTSMPGIGQATYFAKGQWVRAAAGALSERDFKAYLAQSHRLVAAKLTRKARAELGLEA